ncbi:hypothetical protein [Bartonella jaculi]|uniref:B transposition protein C-terminal domain-containing protein n=1 Tax=Bartonella jaculi TaxID=686226 RepID=A0ABP9N8E3_9HYPH
MLIIAINGTDLALVKNNEILGCLVHRQNGLSYAKIKSRLAMNLKRRKPYSEDIITRIYDWEIAPPEAIRFLTSIGFKAGTFCQMEKTIMLARMAACGNGSRITLKHIKDARKTAIWRN